MGIARRTGWYRSFGTGVSGWRSGPGKTAEGRLYTCDPVSLCGALYDDKKSSPAFFKMFRRIKKTFRRFTLNAETFFLTLFQPSGRKDHASTGRSCLISFQEPGCCLSAADRCAAGLSAHHGKPCNCPLSECRL